MRCSAYSSVVFLSNLDIEFPQTFLPPWPPASAMPWSPRTIIKGGKLFFQRSLFSNNSLKKAAVYTIIITLKAAFQMYTISLKKTLVNNRWTLQPKSRSLDYNSRMKFDFEAQQQVLYYSLFYKTVSHTVIIRRHNLVTENSKHLV